MFQGLNTALTALYAGRQALETTGHNIANVNTEGYSRQRVELSPLGGQAVASFFSTASKVGLGVSVADIERLRDEFMESRGLTEHAIQAGMTRQRDTLSRIELTLGEPGDNGLQNQLSEFWASWDDLGNQPDDLAARSQIIEQAETLVTSFRQAANDFSNLANTALEQLKVDVSEVNALAQNIADLNKAIVAANQNGSSPNTLLDQRDLLIGKLSEIVGVNVIQTNAGSVAVNVGGVPLVRDENINYLQVDDTGSPMVLRWDEDNNPATITDGYIANITTGDVGGLMESIVTLIPKYQSQLDTVVQSVISTVNGIHTSGLDQNGNPGIAFFTGTGANDIALEATIAADPTLIAAAAAGGGPLDGENARAMAALANAAVGPDAEYRQVIDVLGTESQRAIRQVEIQATIVSSIDGARQSTSGVNLDEEMTNLVRFQKAYNAAAKYMTTVDQAFDSIIGMLR